MHDCAYGHSGMASRLARQLRLDTCANASLSCRTDFQSVRLASDGLEIRPTELDGSPASLQATFPLGSAALGVADQEVPDGQGGPARALTVAVKARVDLDQVEAGHIRLLPSVPGQREDFFARKASDIWRGHAGHIC